MAYDIIPGVDSSTFEFPKPIYDSLRDKLSTDGKIVPSRETVAKALGFSMIAGEAEPGATHEFGLPVIWLDTRVPRDKSEWVPYTPTFTSTSYKIPSDEGVDYKVDGAIKAPGTYTVSKIPSVVDIYASPKPGYKLSGVTAWSKTFVAVLSDFDEAAQNVGAKWYYRLTDPNNRSSFIGTGAVKAVSINNSTAYHMGDIGSGFPAITGESKLTFNNMPTNPTGTAFMSIVFRLVKSDGTMVKDAMFGLDWYNKYAIRISNQTNVTGEFEIILVSPHGAYTHIKRNSSTGSTHSNFSYTPPTFDFSKSHILSIRLANGKLTYWLDGNKLAELEVSEPIPSTIGLSYPANGTGVSSFLYDDNNFIDDDKILNMHKVFSSK